MNFKLRYEDNNWYYLGPLDEEYSDRNALIIHKNMIRMPDKRMRNYEFTKKELKNILIKAKLRGGL